MASLATTKRQARKQLAASSDAAPDGAGWRIATVLGLVVIAAAAAFVFMVGVGMLDARAAGLGVLDDYLANDPSHVRQLGTIGGSAAVGIVALALILRPVGRRATRISRHVVAMTERGVVLVNSESVATLARLAVRQQAGVLDAEVRVRGSGATPVRLVIRAAVMPGTQLPVVGDAAQAAARDAVERLAGLTVQDVHVELQIMASADLERVLE